MPLLDPNSTDPNDLKKSAALPGYIGGSAGNIQATPQQVVAIPRAANGQAITGAPNPAQGFGMQHYASPAQSLGSPDVAFSSNPYGAAPEYGQQLGNGDPGRAAWRQWVGNTENWIQKEMGGGGKVITGAPSMFQGDIDQLNRYGQYGINPNGTVPEGNLTYKNGLPVGRGEARQATPAEMAALNQYQNYAYGQENQPGGGSIAAWGKQQGYGPDTASGNWGGAYSAYMANQAIQHGVAPGTGYGFGTTAGSSPLGQVRPGMGAPPGAVYFNSTQGGNVYFDQYGRPIGGAQAQPFSTDTESVYQSKLDAQRRAALAANPASGGALPSSSSSNPYDPYANPRG